MATATFKTRKQLFNHLTNDRGLDVRGNLVWLKNYPNDALIGKIYATPTGFYAKLSQ